MNGPASSEIVQLRQKLNLSQSAFGVLLGLGPKSKGRVSLIEGGAPVSQSVALAIEALSDGRIDAARLNLEIAAARAGFVRQADNENTADHGTPLDASTPSGADDGADSGADLGEGASAVGELLRLCFACERRLDLPGIRDCTAVDCPHAQREAA